MDRGERAVRSVVPVGVVVRRGGQCGNVITSTNPVGVASSWPVANVDGANRLSGVSCPSVSLCVAVDGAGNVITSSNPTSGASGWKFAHVDDHGLSHVSCASMFLCVAAIDDERTIGSVAQAADSGNVIISTDPTSGASARGTVSKRTPAPPLQAGGAGSIPAGSTLPALGLQGFCSSRHQLADIDVTSADHDPLPRARLRSSPKLAGDAKAPTKPNQRVPRASVVR
jgi:hypothetical protein